MTNTLYYDKLIEILEKEAREKKELEEEKEKRRAFLKEKRTSMFEELLVYCKPFESFVLTDKTPLRIETTLKDFRITFTKLFSLMVCITDNKDKDPELYIRLTSHLATDNTTFKTVEDTMERVVTILLDRVKYTPRPQLDSQDDSPLEG